MRNLLAAEPIPIAPNGGFQGIGTPLGNPIEAAGGPFGVFSSFISQIIAVMTIIAVIWAVFTIITGAVSIINAGGDKQLLESARKKIINGILGLIIVVASLFIIEIVGYFLGISDILNIQKLLGVGTGTSNVVSPRVTSPNAAGST